MLRRKIPVCWFTSQITAKASVQPDWSQVPGTLARSATWVAGVQILGHQWLLPSHITGSWTGRQEVGCKSCILIGKVDTPVGGLKAHTTNAHHNHILDRSLTFAINTLANCFSGEVSLVKHTFHCCYLSQTSFPLRNLRLIIWWRVSEWTPYVC